MRCNCLFSLSMTPRSAEDTPGVLTPDKNGRRATDCLDVSRSVGLGTQVSGRDAPSTSVSIDTIDFLFEVSRRITNSYLGTVCSMGISQSHCGAAPDPSKKHIISAESLLMNEPAIVNGDNLGGKKRRSE